MEADEIFDIPGLGLLLTLLRDDRHPEQTVRGTAPVPAITSVAKSLNAFWAVQKASNDEVSLDVVARAPAIPEFAGLVQEVQLNQLPTTRS